MFRRGGSGTPAVTIFFDGQPVAARPDDTVAVALLAAGIDVTRETVASGSPRGPFCAMGACFDCVATVDGRHNVQTCLTPVRDGLQVRRQRGRLDIGIGHEG